MADVTQIRVRIGPNGPVRAFKGRFAWALREMIRAGSRGVTPIEQPAPRWSHYIYRLRREGVPIRTIPEKHAGAFPGQHGRYVLSAPVTILTDDDKSGEAA